jgi:alpha-amylase
MEELFSMVVDNPWIHNLTLSEYFEKFEPHGLVYMPTASYDKMSYWVLPTPERISLEHLLELAKNKKIAHADELIKFLHGGFWRQFLVKYYEANNMHKKMMYVRDKLRWVENQWGRTDRTKEALKEIFKAQCNDPYWHGQFGGIYFGFMRRNIYQYLIQAEKIIEEVCQETQKITPKVVLIDLDKDGREEILMETALITLYFHPFRGGSVFEIDHKEKGFNIQNTFQRRKEAYYKDDLEYCVDRWRRYAFYDHFVPDELTVNELIKDTYQELGTFLQTHYHSEVDNRDEVVRANLLAEGKVKINNRVNLLRINKEFEILEGKNEIKITFTIENLMNEPVHLNHLTEIPLYLTGDMISIIFQSDNGESDILDSEMLFTKTIDMHARENDIRFQINLSDPCKVFKYSLETYARIDGGYDSVYQGTVLAFMTPLDLPPKESFSWKMSIILS